MSRQPTVLVVEDEDSQREILAYNLEAEGYRVVQSAEGDGAVALTREEEPDVILLDWMLPGTSGIEICRRLKAASGTRGIPVIMISARSEEVDRVRGLETGADDYLVKPYSVAELMARIRTQLRRTRPGAVGERLEFAGMRVDTTEHRVWYENREVHLGPTEFRLLTTFMERPGRVWTRDQLLDRVWGRDVYVDSRTVDVHVGRLRKALRRATGSEDPIRTVRGTGYALG